MHKQDPRWGEAGFALPTAMFFILGMLAILSIGAVAAVNTQRATVRDANSKSALAVAESGVNTALLRYAEHQDLVTDDYRPCLDAALGPQSRAVALNFQGTAPVGGWCPPVHSGDLGHPFTYWARPYKIGSDRKLDVVSQATIEGVTRRILQTAEIPAGAPGGWKRLGDEALVGIEEVEIYGNGRVIGGVGSNGTVHLRNSGNVCGPVRTGNVAYTTDNSDSKNPPPGCSRPSNIETEEFPPPELPEDIESNNSNWRLAGADPVPSDIWQRGNVDWNDDKDILRVTYSTLSLRGDAPYYLCRLLLQGGSTLSMEKSGGPVHIFFKPPEECGNTTVPFEFANGTKIVHNGEVPGLFIVGSDSIDTTVNPAGGALAAGAVLYAPRTDFIINNGSNLKGAVIAKSVDMSGGAKVEAITGLEDYELPIPGDPAASGIVKDHFIECPAQPVGFDTTAPDFDCGS